MEGNYAFLGMNNKSARRSTTPICGCGRYAIDRNVLVKQGYFGERIPAYSLISPPMTGYYDPNIAKSGRGQFFDLGRAKEYRAKAKEQGEIDGRTSHRSLHQQRRRRQPQRPAIIPMLAKIGIKVKLELMDRAVLTKRRNSGEFELLRRGMAGRSRPGGDHRPGVADRQTLELRRLHQPGVRQADRAAAETGRAGRDRAVLRGRRHPAGGGADRVLAHIRCSRSSTSA